MDQFIMSTVEEASRRLFEDESRRLLFYPVEYLGQSIKFFHFSNPSRSRRHSQHPPQPRQNSAPSCETVIMYMYLDEEFPYRSKLPGLQPTLRQFKEYLPKKGNFRWVCLSCGCGTMSQCASHANPITFVRFFFKTACDDPENPVIQEEVVNDDDVLPQYKGKIVGLVKPYEWTELGDRFGAVTDQQANS